MSTADSVRRHLRVALSVSILLLAALPIPSRAGSLLREVFSNIGGVSLADLTNNPAFPNSPTTTELLTTLFETPVDSQDNYGQRVRGTFTAPLTGNYTFWISSDDASGLFLSTDANPANRRQIAGVTAWTPSRTWEQYAEQKSAPIPLVAGNRYYIEALMKEGGGGDNLAVRWLRPDGLDQGPIPLDLFIAWGQNPEAPRISTQPVPATAAEGGVASFAVGYSNQGPTDVYWQRNGQFIPGATGTTLTLDPVRLADNGALYRAFLSNSLGTATSTAVALTVQADTTRPTLVSAVLSASTQLIVEFSEPVLPPDGAASASFSLSPALPVTAVAQDLTSSRRLRLTIGTVAAGTRYTLTVNNVRDRAATPNLIAANSRIDFEPGGTSPFLIEAEDYNYNSGQTLSTASQMPYRGGAYAGLQGTLGVDFNRSPDGSSAAYRNDTRVPMNENPDLARGNGAWTMNTNFKLGWIAGGQWFNYTRTVPFGRYRVLAAISHGETTPGVLQGSLQRVTSAATTATQTVSDLGTFTGDGTGGWGANRLVPLRDNSGVPRTLEIGGEVTFRMNPVSGDFDYFILMPATPPQITRQPTNTTVIEGREASFSVEIADNDAQSYQWTSNSVPIPGATGRTLILPGVALSANGARLAATAGNAIGSVTSTDAILTVTQDLTPPTVLRAFNNQLSTVVVEFDEPVLVPAASAFTLDNGAAVTAVAQGDTPRRLNLTVTGLAYGTTYTLTLNGVRDRAAAGNAVAPNTTIRFAASELAPASLAGTGPSSTTVTRIGPGDFDIATSGGDIGGTADSAGIGWQTLSGNFDLRVRVDQFRLVDPYATAGLLARVDLSPGGAFAGVFASSPRAGVFFESRATAGSAASVQTIRGGYPVNHPHTWLRLRRVSNVITGFGSMDGTRWTQLGTVTLSLPAQLQVGLSVAGRDPAASTLARFRGYGPATGAVTAPLVQAREGLGVSSRRTRIVFSEIHYHPAPTGPGAVPQFIELFNAGDVFEDLSGWTLGGGDVGYRFPDGFRLAAGQFAVVSANPATLQAATGLTGVLGPFTGSFSGTGGLLQLRDEQNSLKLEMEFSDDPPWPVAADGTGHTLVLVNPSYGENDPRAWAHSARVGGNPGDPDPLVPDPADTVVFNEVLAHTDPPALDFLELYNRSNNEVPLAGYVLTDDIRTNKFRFPAGASIGPRAFLALDETQLGFRLSAAGETLYLVTPDGSRVLDALKFGGQENGVASGRVPDGSPDFRRVATPTPGTANAPRRLEDIVINEVMYNPISNDDADEFIELHNRSASAVSLAGWRFTSGIDFTFPSGASIPAGGFVVVGASRDRLLGNHPSLNPAATFGNWSGRLSNSGERLALAKPDDILSTNELGQVTVETIRIVVSEVAYEDGGRWGKWADGGGSSLELVDPRADLLRASSWADSDETQKAQWQQFTVTSPLRFGTQTPDRLHLGLLGEGECLVDDVEVLGPTGSALLTNGGFETGSGTAATGWSFLGHHSLSRVESTGAFNGSRVLRVIAPGDLDAGRNCIRANLATGLNNDIQGTLRVRARWQAGWPELLLRTRGGGLELTAAMNVPKNLGTPGAPNSRRVPNAGPGIYAVNHSPAVPDASQPVVVTARVSDPDGISSVNLRTRTGDTGAFATTAMRDDGAGGDAVAGDGLWSATISGRAAGTLVQFRVEAFDAAATVASSLFPSGPVFAGAAPVSEANIRWGDPVPFGTFTHIHSWTSPTVDAALNADGLNNTYRDGTLVHGNLRVIYNAGIRRKGSPFTGQADFAVTVPSDDLLLGTADRVYGLTGNGGEEATRMRNQIANWFTRSLRLPYLNSPYIRFFRNGSPHGSVGEDLEQPSNYYAESWYPDGGEGDLRKVAFWFEFRDDGGFDVTGADLGYYRNPNGQYNLSRYRWNWQGRPTGTSANNFADFFNLVTAANDRSAAYEGNLLNLADIDQWMRMFVLDACMGNWDTWGTGNAQNKYIYFQSGGRWRILPWDMDWVLGVGDGPGRRLFGGNDGNVNYMFDYPAFRRMAWRAYREAIEGPFQPSVYQPQFAARSGALAFNQVSGAASPQAIADYLDARREVIRQQLQAADTAGFALTSNGGNDFTSTTPIAAIEGTAPFAAVGIEVNGLPVPTEWLDVSRFRIRVPLTQAVNALTVTGVDRNGNPVAGLSDTVTVRYNGVIERAADFVVISELQYDADAAGASFIELFNRSTTTSFNLSGFRLNGVGYTFPEGSVLAPGTYWVLARDRAAFALAYGSTIPVFGEFPGSLDNNGERLSLVEPTPEGERLVTDVRYDNRRPWPTNAAGLGPSLQLIDPARGSWRVANWAATATNAANRVTPGRANAVAAALPAFPSLWINEVLPGNVAGPTDNAGDRDPYVEIVNTGTSPISLDGLMLSDSFSSLAAWTFPAGTQIPAGGFLTVWADGEPGESIPGVPHTSFRLNPTSGGVALSRLQGSPAAPAVLDYVTWEQIPAGRSLGSIPDGEPRTRRVLFRPTPGAANDPAVPAVNVVINEFMAQNTRTLADPADGDWDDWIELHNAGTNIVDLTGYYLTDNLTNSVSAMFRVPGGYPIPPGGYLIVWADNETSQNNPTNSGLHVNFALSRTGEQIGLFDPTGTVVDSLTFGTQASDISTGRFPDGAAPPFYALETPTPGSANVLAGANRPPAFNPVADVIVPEQSLVAFTARAVDPDAGQTVAYSLGIDAPPGATIDPVSGDFRWPTSEADGPAAYSFLLRATDSGSPARVGTLRVNVTVQEVNRPPVVVGVTNVAIGEGSLLSLALPASDPDLPANTLAFSPVGNLPAGAVLTPDGVLTWTPDESRGGSIVSIAYQVTDNGVPPLSATGEVRVAVAEVNNPPVFAQPTPVTVDEGSAFALQLTASDPEGTAVRFRIDGAAPAGFQLDSITGNVGWTPTEDQGPGSYVILIRATESSPDQLSTVRELLVTVREVNRRPTIGSLGPRLVREGSTLRLAVSASDVDRPAQQLRFSLDPGAPAGAAIDPVTGNFQWTVPDDLGATTNEITIRVTDDGPGALDATSGLRVVTEPQFKVVINEVLRRPTVEGTEFIELLNRSASTAWNLDGFRLSGSNLTYNFPANTRLAPGATLVVAANVAAFRTAFGSGPAVSGAWMGTLGAAADSLTLVLPGSGGGPDTVFDRVDYGGSHPWPSAASASPASLQLIDARRDRNRAGNWAVAGSFTGNRDVTGFTDAWRYFQSGAPAGGTAWSSAAFDDAAWASGGGLFYVESAALPTNKTTALALGQTTYYFRKKVTLPPLLPGMTVQVRTILDDGYILWVNGQRAHFLGMEDAPATHDTFANRVVGDGAIEGPFEIPASLFVPGENTLAVEVHQANVGSSDIVFGLELTLVGGTATPATPGLANNVLGSLPEFPTLRINEVLARNTTGLTDNTGTPEPWIELVNTGTEPVSLDGLYLSDSDAEPLRWAFPAGRSIPAGGFLTLFADGQPGQTDASELHTSFRLASTAGAPLRLTLSRLVNGSTNNVDYFHSTVGTLPNVSSGRVPDGFVASLAELTPSPGVPNPGVSANRPPVFPAPANVSLDEGGTVQLTLAATDPDAGQTLAFRLVSGPAALAVSPAGALNWTTTEADGPGTFAVRVAVSDSGTPSLSVTNGFEITVREVNVLPVFPVVPPQSVQAGQSFALDLLASDPDLPAQTLLFDLLQGPAGVNLSGSGALRWTPGAGQVGPNAIVVRVTDSGLPPQSATNSFTVTVQTVTPAAPQFDPPALEPDGKVRLVLRGTAGMRYRVERSAGLGPWESVTEWTADNAGLVLLEIPGDGASARLYRAVQVSP